MDKGMAPSIIIECALVSVACAIAMSGRRPGFGWFKVLMAWAIIRLSLPTATRVISGGGIPEARVFVLVAAAFVALLAWSLYRDVRAGSKKGGDR